ncbi:hypothetical protein TKK_0005898 [Trichogramma kaykai]|uniref:Choline transporter-like protein n=1 Tax=Trichogramma kaykai TaxID=54128 RepID=A0ABD2XFJ9_9HYME
MMANNQEKYGKKIPYDPLWKGPVDVIRFPTDRIWLVTFLLYTSVYIANAIYGLSRGNLNKLDIPYDYADRACGLDPEVQDKPYLLILDLKNCSGLEHECLAPSTCVSQCPTENFIYKRETNTDSLDKVKEKLHCTADINVTSIASFDQLDLLISHKKCAKWYLKSEPWRNKCLAQNAWEGHENETISSDELFEVRVAIKEMEHIVQKFYSYSTKALTPTLVAIICGGVLALLYVIQLRWFAVPSFYASVAVFLLLAFFGIYKLIEDYVHHKKSDTLISLICVSLIVLLVIALIIIMRKNIYLGCQLIKESSKAMMQLPMTLVFPILPYLLYVLVIALTTTALLSFSTITIPKYIIDRIGDGTADGCQCLGNYTDLLDGAPCDPIVFSNECSANGQPCQFLQCRQDRIENPQYISFLHTINVVGFIWLMFFISGFEYMVLGGAFASWYWTYNKNNVRKYCVLESLFRTTRFHLGTVSIGSLILTVSQIVKLIFRALQDRLRSTGAGACAGSLCFCFRYAYEMLDSLLNFLNYNAYIMCAIHGKGFCQSAKSAFNLIMRNLMKIVAVDTITDWMFVMAKLFVASMAVFGVSLYYSLTLDEETADPEFVGIALLGTAIGVFMIASVFFSVQSVAVKTIFLCFIEDSERNDGTEEKPYFMSNKLMKLIYK